MKRINNILTVLMAIAMLALFTAPTETKAADYAIQKTFWSASSITNAAGVVTNLNTAVDCTQFTDFLLEVKLSFTNASAGTYDIPWAFSGNGTDISNSGAGSSSSRGWFSVPLTNGSTTIYWTTNITVNSAGYWFITTPTNAAVQHLTNALITARVKPKRTSSDF